MLTLKKAFAGAAALAVAGIGITALVSPSDAATPGVCPVSGIVTAEAPIFTDRDGEANDTVTIPESDCINYTINGWDTHGGGTFNLNNLTAYGLTDSSNGWRMATAVVQAEPKADHWQLSGAYWWSQGFIGIYDPKGEVIQTMTGLPAMPKAMVTPTAPTFQNTDSASATVTIPQQKGVAYTIKGNKKTEVVAAGTYKILDFAFATNNKAAITVTATTADKKHIQLIGTTSWVQEISTASVPAPTSTPTPSTQPTTPSPQPTTSSPAIDDGIYVITSALNNNKALDVNAESKDAGANVQLWDRNNGKAQRFKVTHLGGNQYSIINENSGKALDIDGNSKKAGANVHQWTWSGANNQRFTITPAKNGGYSIQAVSSSLFLDVYGSRTANGTNVIQWTDNGGTANQRWNFNAQTSSPTPSPNPTTDPVKKVSFVAPTFDQKNNTYTIPDVEGLQYSVDGKNVAAGTYKVTGNADSDGKTTISVTAKPKAGYVSDSGYVSYTWSATFAVRTVTPVAPTYKAGWSFWFINVQSEYTIPSVTGIDYYVNGSKVAAGTYKIPRGTSISVEAKPQQGYSFPLNTIVINRWTFQSL